MASITITPVPTPNVVFDSSSAASVRLLRAKRTHHAQRIAHAAQPAARSLVVRSVRARPAEGPMDPDHQQRRAAE